MNTDIILSGVGGQGILSIATIIGAAAIKEKLYIKQAEVHIISLEPMEAMRYLPYLKKDGWIITNTAPFINIPNYPELQELLDSIKAIDHHVSLDVDAIAKEVASPRAANIVLLGAASPFLGIEVEKIEEGIRNVFDRKGEAIVEMNLKAFRAGLEVADKHINK